MFNLVSVKCARCGREMVLHKDDMSFENYCGLCSTVRNYEKNKGVKDAT